MKKTLKITLIILSVLAGVSLLGSFGFNWWLKNKLPELLNKNPDYSIQYQALEVKVLSGNIIATQVKIQTKKADNFNIPNVNGSIESIKINRLNLFDAIFKKEISSSHLYLVKPNLKIRLPNAKNSKTEKKYSAFPFKNLKIKDGNLLINKPSGSILFSINHLDLSLNKIKTNHEEGNGKLPIVFDQYFIKGDRLFFQKDIYLISANSIETTKGAVDLNGFKLTPLLNTQQVQKYYPKRREFYSIKTNLATISDIVIKEKKLSLANVLLVHPELVIYKTTTIKEETKKEFLFDFSLQTLSIQNANIQVFNPQEQCVFSLPRLTIKADELKMNEQTTKNSLPFSYQNFAVEGSELMLQTEHQTINILAFSANPKSVLAKRISVKPSEKNTAEPLLNFTLAALSSQMNEFRFENQKLKLNVENVLFDGLNGVFKAPKTQKRKMNSFEFVSFPLKVKNVTLKNSNVVIDRPENPLSFNDLYANLQEIELNEKTIKEPIPVKVGGYTFTTKNFRYRTRFYSFSAGLLKFQKNDFLMNNFTMTPNYSRAQFIKMIPFEKDLYTININQISGKGSWELVQGKKYLNASQITISGVNANVFRSKIPKDDPKIKPMYSALLRKINFPMLLKNMDIKNSNLVYEEDTKTSDGPGKLIFGNLNMNIKNLNSGKTKGSPTQIPISISCSFMNTSPLHLDWIMDTASTTDNFKIFGTISSLPAEKINAFIEPYLNIKATGYIQSLYFNFYGNKNGLDGKMKMEHQALKVSIFKKTGEKGKLATTVANMFIRNNSNKMSETVIVDNVQRNPTKSFFNLFWLGIQEGLKKILIGKNVEKTEASVKNTVSNTKEALKQNKKELKEVKNQLKNSLENTSGKQKKKEKQKEKQETSDKKPGFFKRVFHKKEKVE